MTEPWPFVGRKRELERLERLHAQRRHVLVLGPAGVGKSALLAQVAGRLPLSVCPASERLAEICTALECELGLPDTRLHLIPRKNRLLRALAERGRSVVFDGVGWTSPRVASFLGSVMERVPTWIGTRSEHSWDIGHIWLRLARFARVEVPLFHPADTRALVEAAIEARRIPSAAREVAGQLHRLAAGGPRVLCELLDGLASAQYDPRKRFDLTLLDLDRRIRQLPVSTELRASQP